MNKYHVALSFAGEDREYIEQVAVHLRDEGVDVFYDKFEEDDLWGKDLYTHLSDVYQKRAYFTVMFVSAAYGTKLWPNHERKSAQARAFTESREYILPAFFDESVEVPGLLRTTGYISLKNKSPEDLAKLIVSKLQKSDVRISKRMSYSADAKADIDFPLVKGDKVAEIIRKLKLYSWYTQSPAIAELLDLDWAKLSPDQLFVLGRNMYQSACGSERKAVDFVQNARRELAKFPDDQALHFLNGMFYEVYFNAKGEFRGGAIKGRCLENLLELQSVKKFEPSIMFIRSALEPYRAELPFLPNQIPEPLVVEVEVRKSDPPLAKGLKLNGRNVLFDAAKSDEPPDSVWRLSVRDFTIEQLKEELAQAWNLPLQQVTVSCKPKIESATKLRLPDGKVVRLSE